MYVINLLKHSFLHTSSWFMLRGREASLWGGSASCLCCRQCRGRGGESNAWCVHGEASCCVPVCSSSGPASASAQSPPSLSVYPANPGLWLRVSGRCVPPCWPGQSRADGAAVVPGWLEERSFWLVSSGDPQQTRWPSRWASVKAARPGGGRLRDGLERETQGGEGGVKQPFLITKGLAPH